MNLNKKILLSLGTITTIVMPITTVISCGSSQTKDSNKSSVQAAVESPQKIQREIKAQKDALETKARELEGKMFLKESFDILPSKLKIDNKEDVINFLYKEDDAEIILGHNAQTDFSNFKTTDIDDEHGSLTISFDITTYYRGSTYHIESETIKMKIENMLTPHKITLNEKTIADEKWIEDNLNGTTIRAEDFNDPEWNLHAGGRKYNYYNNGNKGEYRSEAGHDILSDNNPNFRGFEQCLEVKLPSQFHNSDLKINSIVFASDGSYPVSYAGHFEYHSDGYENGVPYCDVYQGELPTPGIDDVKWKVTNDLDTDSHTLVYKFNVSYGLAKNKDIYIMLYGH